MFNSSPGPIYRSGSGPEDSRLDVNDQFEKYCDREPKEYVEGLFEWTHLRIKNSSKDYHRYIFFLVLEIVRGFDIDTFEAAIRDGSQNLVGDITQMRLKFPGQDPVKAEINVYSGTDKEIWVVLRRKTGDEFLFQDLFEEIICHDQIQEKLYEKEVTE